MDNLSNDSSDNITVETETLGGRLTMFRLARKWGIVTAANKIGILPNLLARLERNRTVPDPELLHRIYAAYGVVTEEAQVNLVLARSMQEFSQRVHQNSVEHGWWQKDGTDNVPEKMALIHSEVSEWLEVIRHEDEPDDKLPAYSKGELEAADIIIRTLDLAQALGYRIGEALVAKHTYNRTRPYRHGNKKF